MLGPIRVSIGVGVSGSKTESIVEGILTVFWLSGESAIGGGDGNEGGIGPDVDRNGGA